MDPHYIDELVGPILKGLLAEVVEKKPHDPIEYLASLLYKYKEEQDLRKEVYSHVKSLLVLSNLLAERFTGK